MSIKQKNVQIHIILGDKMLLDKILEYQKVDRDLYLLENEFRNSKEVRAVAHLRSIFSEDQETQKDLRKEVEELFNNFAKGLETLKGIDALESEVTMDLKVIEEQEELDAYDKTLMKYENYLNASEREINKIIKRLSDIKFETQKLQEKLVETNKRHQQQSKLREGKKEELQQKAKPIVLKLKELQKDIDKDLLKKYLIRRKENKMPVFVEYRDGSCSGCGLGIAIEVNHKLVKSGDIAECPECRRIVYKA